MAKLEWTPHYFTIYYQLILLHSIIYNNEVDKSMDKKIRRLYLHEIAFNLIPQQLFCTQAKTLRESRKRNMILKYLCPHVDVLHHNGSLHRSTN